MVKGVANIQRQFASVPGYIIREVEAELEVVGRDLVAQMKALAPYDEFDLIASIGFDRKGRDVGTATIRTLKGAASYGFIGILVYAGRGLTENRDENYAIFQEFGTKDMPANPYFFPTYRSNRSRLRAKITRAVTRGVKKANAKG